MNSVHMGGLGGTYAGNPVACEAALAVFEVLDDPATLANVARIEKRRARQVGSVGRRRSPSSPTCAVAEPCSRSSSPTPTSLRAPSSPPAISRACHQAGVLTLTTGTHGNVIRLLPPLIAEPELVARGVDILVAAIREADGMSGPADLLDLDDQFTDAERATRDEIRAFVDSIRPIDPRMV